MSPNRWKQLEPILEAALEQNPEQRKAFLARIGTEDELLRHEVEELIQAYEAAGNFIEEPPLLLATVADTAFDTAPATRPEFTIVEKGKDFGPYRIEREIGRGGMGAVYLAVRNDQTTAEPVAIKLIKRGMDTDFVLKRFRREHQILASLHHRNIAALIDGGSTSDGLPYFVMEYIEGQPIQRYCNDRRLSISERLQLLQQVCAAVAYAHQKQIIHRDIKPGNILVTADGVVKLLDFGIAKLLNPEMIADTIDTTATAMRLMTPEYASPEQVRGLPVTPASDVYSLGILMYELLTGHRPYRLNSRAPHEMARVICEETPTRPSSIVSRIEEIPQFSGLPRIITPAAISAERQTTPENLAAALTGNLDNIIIKSLQKDAQHRYSTADELATDLALHLAGKIIAAPVSPAVDEMPKSLIVEEAPTARSIAVFPFKVVQSSSRSENPDEPYLGVGVADSLVMQLSNIRGLIVRPLNTVVKYAEAGVDVFEAGREMGVDYALDGRIQVAGAGARPLRLRVTVQLVALKDRAIVWAAQFNEKYSDILTMQDTIAAQVAESLVTRLTVEERARLVRRGTESPEAYEAYLRGRYHWHSYTVEGLAKALVHFSEAISIDPEFAAPYAGIAEYYNRLATFGIIPSSECFAAAKEAARKSVRLDDTLAEAWAALAFATLGADWDFDESSRLIRRALELNPTLVQAYEWHSHILSLSGHPTAAVRLIERALELDPQSSALHVLHCFHLHLARRDKEALEAADRALYFDPQSFWALFAQVMQSAELGKTDVADRYAKKMMETNPDHPIGLAALAFAQARSEKPAEARQTLDRLLAVAQESYATPYYIALTCAELGEVETALRYIEEGLKQRDWWTLYSLVDPSFSPLRKSKIYQEALKEIGVKLPIPISSNPQTPVPVTPAPAPAATISPTPSRWKWRPLALAAILLVIAIGAYKIFSPSSRNYSFQTIKSVKLTTTGNAVTAAISPDKKYVAFVLEDAGKQSLWIRQLVIANSIRLKAPADVDYRGLTFSRDGTQIRYVTGDRASGKGTLYQIPVLGGEPKKLKEGVDSAAGYSPDGKRFAFVRHHREEGEDDLIIANEDGTNEKQITVRKFPDHFSINSAPAWSPDEKTITCVIETSDAQGFFMKAVQYQLSDGKELPFTSGRWMVIDQILRRPDGSWLMAAQDTNSPFLQLWLFSSGGQGRKLTNDLGDYKSLSAPSEPGELVSVVRQTLTNIWVAPKGTPSNIMQITSGAGRYFDLAWMPDGQILYASDANSSADIWMRQSTSREQRQLTTGPGRSYGPASSPDGRFVVFHSNRSGNWQIWRMNRDGTDQIQLTSGNEESNWPQITPDGQTVIFEHTGAGTLTSLWKIPFEGGELTRLTTGLSIRPSISPDGKLIACWHKEQTPGAQWQIALIPIQGGTPVREIDVRQSDASGGTTLRWTPDGKQVIYTDFRDGITSLWMQPIDGGEPKKLTESTNEIIYAFDLARDGRLALSRGIRSHDVVLITDAEKASDY